MSTQFSTQICTRIVLCILQYLQYCELNYLPCFHTILSYNTKLSGVVLCILRYLQLCIELSSLGSHNFRDNTNSSHRCKPNCTCCLAPSSIFSFPFHFIYCMFLNGLVNPTLRQIKYLSSDKPVFSLALQRITTIN